MSVKVTAKIDMSGIYSKFSKVNQAKTRAFMAEEIVRMTDPYVPFDKGYLRGSANIASDGSYFEYNMPYARRLYYNPQFNFKGAPQRGGLWVERSIAIHREAIENAVLRYIERL